MTTFLPRAHILNLRAWGPARSYQDRMSIFRLTGYETTRTGGRRPIYELHSSAQPCRKARNFIQGTENTIGGQLQDVKRAVIYTPPSADIRATDRLEIQPDEDETEPWVIDVVSHELDNTYDLEHITTGLVVGGRGTATP